MLHALKLLFNLLRPHERARFVRIGLAVTFSNFLETMSVAALLPFMIVVSQPEAAFDGLIGEFYAMVGTPERGPFLLIFGGGLLGLVLTANLIAGITIWRLSRFAWYLDHAIGERMLLNYVRQPYSFFLGRNTAELTKNVLDEVQKSVTGVIMPVLYGFARGGFALFVTMMLVLVDPETALVGAALVGGGYALIYRSVRPRLNHFGELRLESNKGRFGAATEALTGIKAVKILGREKIFMERFSVPSAKHALATANREFLTVAPRYALESVAFGGMIALVMLILVRPGGPEGVLPLLAVFGFAGVKLMPATQQIFASVATVKFYTPTLQKIYDELQSEDDQQITAESGAERSQTEPPLAMRSVSFRYPGADAAALSDVSLTVERGQLHGFVGQTGSGKTTAMDLLVGLLEPTSGSVLVEGREVSPEEFAAWRRGVGYVPQEIFLTDDTIEGNIAFGVPEAEVDRDRVREVARLALVDEVVDALPDGYRTTVGERGVRLSGGQRQRIGIARALYLEPELVVFDEGTSALDPSTESQLVDNLLSAGLTVLWVTHRLATVRRFHTIFVFDEGRLAGVGAHEELVDSCPAYQVQSVQSPERPEPVADVPSGSHPS